MVLLVFVLDVTLQGVVSSETSVVSNEKTPWPFSLIFRSGLVNETTASKEENHNEPSAYSKKNDTLRHYLSQQSRYQQRSRQNNPYLIGNVVVCIRVIHVMVMVELQVRKR